MKHAAIFCLLLLLTACGFQPLYGDKGARTISPQLAQVSVAPISDAAGQQLRNFLLDRLPPPAPSPRYQLNIALAESKVGIAISRDATITRQQLRSVVTASLMDRTKNETVWTQQIFTTSGYNVLGSQFSTLVGEEDARTRNLNDLSERVVNMLALYFERGKTESAHETPGNITIAPHQLSPLPSRQ